MAARTFWIAALLAASSAPMAGCATMKTAGKVGATPLAVARDIVDAPLVTVANVFEFFADHSRIAKAPSAGVGVGLGGVSPFIGYDMSFFFFKGLSWIVGGTDYLICRSVWPNHPYGVCPWAEKGQGWGRLYFVNTRGLWGDIPSKAEKKEPPQPKKEIEDA